MGLFGPVLESWKTEVGKSEQNHWFCSESVQMGTDNLSGTSAKSIVREFCSDSMESTRNPLGFLWNMWGSVMSSHSTILLWDNVTDSRCVRAWIPRHNIFIEVACFVQLLHKSQVSHFTVCVWCKSGWCHADMCAGITKGGLCNLKIKIEVVVNEHQVWNFFFFFFFEAMHSLSMNWQYFCSFVQIQTPPCVKLWK
jgi:hypothetical protein